MTPDHERIGMFLSLLPVLLHKLGGVAVCSFAELENLENIRKMIVCEPDGDNVIVRFSDLIPPADVDRSTETENVWFADRPGHS